MDIELVATLHGHTEEVRNVAFSPDGSLVLSIGEDGLHLWSVADHHLLRVLDGPRPRELCFAAQASTFAALGEGGGIRLYQSSGELLGEIATQDTDTLRIALSPDGTILASGDSKGYVCLWDSRTSDLLCSFQAAPHGEVELSMEPRRGMFPAVRPRPQVLGIAFTPDGTRLALICRDQRGSVQLWDVLEAGRQVEWAGAILALSQDPWSLAFSPDGQFLAIAEYLHDEVVYLFQTSTLAAEGLIRMPEEDIAKALAFSPDSRFLATAGGAGTVWIWDIVSREIITSFAAHHDGCDHRKGDQFFSIGGLDWARSGEMIVTSGMCPRMYDDLDPYTVKLWKVHL